MQTANKKATCHGEFQKSDHYKDAYLLSQTNTWTCVEWKEYEGVGYEIFVQTIVKESVRIEF